MFMCAVVSFYQHSRRDFLTSSKSSRRLMNPEWSSSDSGGSIFLPTNKEWKPSVAKKLFIPRRAKVSAAIMSFPNGTNEAVVLRSKMGDGLRSGAWTPIHMRLELNDVDTSRKSTWILASMSASRCALITFQTQML